MCAMCLCVCVFESAPVMSDSFGNKALESILIKLVEVSVSLWCVSVNLFVLHEAENEFLTNFYVTFRGEVKSMWPNTR